MRKLLAVLFVLVVSTSFAFSKITIPAPKTDQEFIVKLGIQPQSTIKLNGDSENTNIGTSLGVEYFKYLGNVIAVGAGATYDLPRNFRDTYAGSVSFLPLYVGIKARTPLHGLDDNYGFITGRIGYSAFIPSNDFMRSTSGGLYYSGGVGISVSYLVIEAIYSIENFSYKSVTDNSSNSTYASTISLYVGFKFE